MGEKQRGLGTAHVAVAILVVVLVGVSAACSQSTAGKPVADPAATKPAIQLPRSVWPKFLTFAKDGSLWVTESSGDAVASIDTNGHIEQHRIPGSDNEPSDIAEGPDSAMWFQGFEMIGRIGRNGDVTGWRLTMHDNRVGLPAALTLGPDNAIWYTDESVPPRITRLTSGGDFTSTQIPASPSGISMSGITAGPDGAVWFTESSDSHDTPVSAIGRVGTDGRYASWPLPTPRSTPMRITKGPDNALWFTERSGYRIGSITVSGAITEYPLPPGISPFDITAGSDGAVWFSTDKGIGRLSTAREMTLTDIPRATSIVGIAAAPDGTFRLTDAKAGAIWTFDPRA